MSGLPKEITPGPLTVPEAYTGCNGQRITGGVFSTDDDAPDILIGEFHFRADAERAVACWNACLGYDDPQELLSQNQELRREVERLRTENGELKTLKLAFDQTPKQWSTAQAPTMEAVIHAAKGFMARTENERLRKALRQIEEYEPDYHMRTDWNVANVKAIAREALTQESTV